MFGVFRRATPGAEAREGTVTGRDPARRIRLRRFAGPAQYANGLDHLRVAHLTDLHFGRVTPMAIQRAAVELTNAQKPDLVAITGDFVCHSQLYLDQLGEVIAAIEAPVVGVLGNHDHWSGADEVRLALRRAGALVLDNRHTVLTLRGQRLQVVGLDDAYTGHARRELAVKGLRRDLPTLALSHIAEEADGLWRHDIPLVLSGHTHAGQLTFARLHELTLGKIAGHRYVHGLYGTRAAEASGTAGAQARSAWAAAAVAGQPAFAAARGAVYVGAGIGASVMPLRIGDRGQREVAVFELGHLPGSFDEHHGEQPPLRGRKPSPAVRAKRAAAVVAMRERRERIAAGS